MTFTNRIKKSKCIPYFNYNKKWRKIYFSLLDSIKLAHKLIKSQEPHKIDFFEKEFALNPKMY